MNLMSLAMPLVSIGISKLIDAENPQHKQWCLFAFMFAQGVCAVALLFIRYRIVSADDQKIVEVEEKPDPWAVPEEKTEDDGKSKQTKKAEPKKIKKMTTVFTLPFATARSRVAPMT